MMELKNLSHYVLVLIGVYFTLHILFLWWESFAKKLKKSSIEDFDQMVERKKLLFSLQGTPSTQVSSEELVENYSNQA